LGMADTHKSLAATVCDKMHRLGDELFANPKTMAADALAGVPHHTHHETHEHHAGKTMEALGHMISIPKTEAFDVCADGPPTPGQHAPCSMGDTIHHAGEVVHHLGDTLFADTRMEAADVLAHVPHQAHPHAAHNGARRGSKVAEEIGHLVSIPTPAQIMGAGH
jgi:hypothetical protein